MSPFNQVTCPPSTPPVSCPSALQQMWRWPGAMGHPPHGVARAAFAIEQAGNSLYLTGAATPLTPSSAGPPIPASCSLSRPLPLPRPGGYTEESDGTAPTNRPMPLPYALDALAAPPLCRPSPATYSGAAKARPYALTPALVGSTSLT
jgi:hypothetical protein